MANFKQGGGFGGDRGKRSFGGKPSFNRGSNRGSAPAQMFSATCATCHQTCEVPFRPNGEKPVYCHDCFRKTSNDFSARPERKFSSSNFSNAKPMMVEKDKRIDELKKQLDLVNSKLDNLIEIISGREKSINKVKIISDGKEEGINKKVPAKKKVATKKK